MPAYAQHRAIHTRDIFTPKLPLIMRVHVVLAREMGPMLICGGVKDGEVW